MTGVCVDHVGGTNTLPLVFSAPLLKRSLGGEFNKAKADRKSLCVAAKTHKTEQSVEVVILDTFDPAWRRKKVRSCWKWNLSQRLRKCPRISTQREVKNLPSPFFLLPQT